ncbi:hypothetical protein DRP05_13265 [Archaeoglobales archaeon]|nr:MAG: hypothetical protein DRP05_13265 [Archaeoglobales archaeon]
MSVGRRREMDKQLELKKKWLEQEIKILELLEKVEELKAKLHKLEKKLGKREKSTKTKKYDVPLILASTKDVEKLALARMILDMMELDELYSELESNTSSEDIKMMESEDIFELLDIDFEERSKKLDEAEADKLKNYDVALAFATVGKIEEARKVMETINPKKELTISDFEFLK